MPRTQLSFATCNLYNLNRPGLHIYTDSDGWSAPEYAAKIAWLSRTLQTVDADCWGFQELWHRQALQDAFNTAGLAQTYTLLVPAGQTGQRIVCAGAVRSAILVGDPEWITDFPPGVRLESGGDDPQTSEISVSIDTFSRPLLHFRIRPRSGGRIIQVFVAHLKSKLPTAVFREGWYRADTDTYHDHSQDIGSAISTIRRTAEALALRVILNGVMKGSDTPVVVLGDLNDGQHSNTLNLITGQPNYLVGLSTGGSDTDLYAVGTLEQYRSQRDVYYTHVFQRQRESLDHIMVSQEFYDNSTSRLWAFKGIEEYNDHLNTEDHKANGSSDHGILKAMFEYRPA